MWYYGYLRSKQLKKKTDYKFKWVYNGIRYCSVFGKAPDAKRGESLNGDL